MAQRPNTAPRDPVATSDTADLAAFLNRSRVEPPSDAHIKRNGNFTPIEVTSGAIDTSAHGVAEPEAAPEAQPPSPDPGVIVCGPLLNYRRLEGGSWHGSVLIVVTGGGKELPPPPTLTLRQVDVEKARAAIDRLLHASPEADPSATDMGGATNVTSESTSADDSPTKVEGTCLYSDPDHTFWAFEISVELKSVQSAWEYALPDKRFNSPTKPRQNCFFAPALDESMRIMFHSCNGFSVGTNEVDWSGPVLWKDVLRRHLETPLHVM